MKDQPLIWVFEIASALIFNRRSLLIIRVCAFLALSISISKFYFRGKFQAGVFQYVTRINPCVISCRFCCFVAVNAVSVAVLAFVGVVFF